MQLLRNEYPQNNGEIISTESSHTVHEITISPWEFRRKANDVVAVTVKY